MGKPNHENRHRSIAILWVKWSDGIIRPALDLKAEPLVSRHITERYIFTRKVAHLHRRLDGLAAQIQRASEVDRDFELRRSREREDAQSG